MYMVVRPILEVTAILPKSSRDIGTDLREPMKLRRGKTMKKLMFVCLLVLTAPTLLAAEGVDYFHSDWEKAKETAKKQDKPIYVHFTTEWCGWCRRIEDDVYRKAEGKKALEPFVPVSLDCTVRDREGEALKEAQENRKLMEQWGGGGYPFLVQVTPEGVVFNSWSGYRPMQQFTTALKDALQSLKEFRAFQERARTADRDSYEFNLQAMKVYSDVQQHDKALEAANRVLELDPNNEQNNGARAAMVRLQALQKMGKGAEAYDALQKVQKFDPKNKKGLWEQATSEYAIGVLRGGRAQNPAERQKSFNRAMTALQDLTEADVELEKPQEDLYFLGIFYAQKGSKQKAVDALKQAVAAAPDSRLARRIKTIIERLQK
jgi:protein disulfide-isomerase